MFHHKSRAWAVILTGVTPEKDNMAPLKEKPKFVKCEETGRLYNPEAFPLQCATCKKIYPERDSYLHNTQPLPKGDYSKGVRSLIFEYRNCSCGSTIVCEVESERDDSAEGEIRRKEYDKQGEFLMNNGIEMKRAKEIIRKRWKGY